MFLPCKIKYQKRRVQKVHDCTPFQSLGKILLCYSSKWLSHSNDHVLAFNVLGHLFTSCRFTFTCLPNHALSNSFPHRKRLLTWTGTVKLDAFIFHSTKLNFCIQLATCINWQWIPNIISIFGCAQNWIQSIEFFFIAYRLFKCCN